MFLDNNYLTTTTMKNYILLFAAILCITIGACKKDHTASGSGSTLVTVKLTDAPGLYDAVILSIKSVVVVTDKGEQTITVGGGPINILHFRLGQDTLLASKDIPSGVIQQIRLVLNDSGNVVVVNGTSYNLTTPSGQTSGVKLNVHDNLVA